MQRFDGNFPIPDEFRGGVVALGNFDGFHLGHQAVVGRAVALARQAGKPALVATFDPHPIRHFRPDTPPFRLTTLDQRERLFGEAGADGMIVYSFNAELAALTAAEFAQQRLAGFSAVVTGQDFTFGRSKGGNVDVLAELGAQLGFRTEAVASVSDSSETISSSRIRAALKEGDCATAAVLLTRPFTVQGIVQHGDKNGRKLGFPTANIDMGTYLRPKYGIYAVRGRLADGRVLNGAANIGVRPQFDPPQELLEPFFFDFAEDLYGQTIEVEFHAFIRGEEKFVSLEALSAQMARDCDEARRILGE
jgi:riboflavin kinase / FMN adenylyltransferase